MKINRERSILLFFLLIMLCIFGCIMITNVTAAESEIKVIYKDEPIKFDVLPIIESGRTLVPMRAILEALGALVD